MILELFLLQVNAFSLNHAEASLSAVMNSSEPLCVTETEPKKILELSKTRLSEKKYAEALFCANQVISQDSKNAEAHHQAALIHCEQKRWDLAIASASKATELAPNDASYHYTLGEIYLSKSIESDQTTHEASSPELDLAIKEFGKVTELNPKHALAWAKLGDIFSTYVISDWKIYFERAIEAEPANATMHYRFAEKLFFDRFQPDSALAEVEAQKAITLDPTLHEAYGLLGRAKLITHSLESAEQLLKKAVELAPKVALYQYLMGELTILKWQDFADPSDSESELAFKAAAQYYQAAVKLNPKYSDALLALQNVAYHAGLFETSIEAGLALDKLEPHHTLTVYRLGLAYMALKDHHTALTYFREAASHSDDIRSGDPQRSAGKSLDEASSAASRAAEIYQQYEDHEKAIEYFETAYKTLNKDLGLVYTLAKACFYGGHYVKAERYYAEALALAEDLRSANPGGVDSSFYYSYAVFKATLQQSKEARKALDSMVNVEHEKANLEIESSSIKSERASRKSYVYFLLQSYADAVNSAKEAIALEPQNSKHYYILGTIYAGMGNKTQALAMFEKALSIAPKNTTYEIEKYRMEAELGRLRFTPELTSKLSTLWSDILYATPRSTDTSLNLLNLIRVLYYLKTKESLNMAYKSTEQALKEFPRAPYLKAMYSEISKTLFPKASSWLTLALSAYKTDNVARSSNALMTLVYLRSKKWDQSIESFRLSYQAWGPAKMLQILADDLNETERAQAIAGLEKSVRIINLKDKLFSGLFFKGTLEFMNGDHTTAVKSLKLARQLGNGTESHLVEYVLALAYEGAGLKEMAKLTKDNLSVTEPALYEVLMQQQEVKP